MPKLHFCDDNVSIVDKVLKYKKSRSNDDYLHIYKYYNNYKDKWFLELQEYLDRASFDSEFDFKLCRAVLKFNEKEAKKLCKKYNWNFLGAFNRWFYAVLRNWKSNVKTSAFRQKKRPSVQCPVCFKYVTKIDEEHLQHYKTLTHLPKAVVWSGNVYSVMFRPEKKAVCWGEYTKIKLNSINEGKTKDFAKKMVKWLWFTKEGKRGVVCPFTKKIVPEINSEYIQTLPSKYNRYAKPYSWQNFVEEFPYPMLIQAEIYSLDYHKADDDASLYDNISIMSASDVLEKSDISKGRVTTEYEHVFHLIEELVFDEIDKKILKLTAIGYVDDDIAEEMKMERKEIRQRKKNIGLDNQFLQKELIESC